MNPAKQYLINTWRSLIFIGETRLWFSGAVGALCMIGLFFFAIVKTISSTYTIKDWAIAAIILGTTIPLLSILLLGYVRGKLRQPSIENAADFVYTEPYSIMGMVWLLNIIGVIFLIAIFGFLIQLYSAS